MFVHREESLVFRSEENPMLNRSRDLHSEDREQYIDGRKDIEEHMPSRRIPCNSGCACRGFQNREILCAVSDDASGHQSGGGIRAIHYSSPAASIETARDNRIRCSDCEAADGIPGTKPAILQDTVGAAVEVHATIGSKPRESRSRHYRLCSASVPAARLSL